MNTRIIFSFTLFILFCLPLASSAHLAAGEDRTVGGYLVDFGYEPKEPQAGQSTSLAVNLVDAHDQAPVDFDRMWLRISRGDEVVFSGNLSPVVAGNITWSYIFSGPGNYEIATTFYHDDVELVHQVFQLGVTSTQATLNQETNQDRNAISPYVYMGLTGFFGFAIGVVAAYTSRKRVQ